MTEEIKPTLDMPLKEAINELTGFEVIGIQKHYGAQFEQLGGIQAICGTVWAFENRTVKTEWSAIERRTIRELNGYFAERDADPESDQGND